MAFKGEHAESSCDRDGAGLHGLGGDRSLASPDAGSGQEEGFVEPGSAIQISEDKKAIKVLRFIRITAPEFGVTLVNAETGQVVANLTGHGYFYGVMSDDHARLMRMREQPSKAIEMWDIASLLP